MQDSALAARIAEEIQQAIANKTAQLIADPNPGLAGEIRGLQGALAMIDNNFKNFSQRTIRSPGETQ